MVKFQPSKLAMRVRFPLPAHLSLKMTLDSKRGGANLVGALNVPIKFFITRNFFTVNSCFGVIDDAVVRPFRFSIPINFHAARAAFHHNGKPLALLFHDAALDLICA